GSRLVGGALIAQLAREAACEQILEGFVPRVSRTDLPSRGARVAGLSELGLPYASDPAITRHAAAFLRRHEPTVAEALGPGAAVDAVLYNGGALRAELLARRLGEVVQSWAEGPLRRVRRRASGLAAAAGRAPCGRGR